MGYFRKTLERRTFSQDRYYILIKKQKAGTAKLDELVELDEIVNRVPDIREKVIIENFLGDDGTGANNEDGIENTMIIHPGKGRNLFARLRSFFHRVFMVQVTFFKTGYIAPVL